MTKFLFLLFLGLLTANGYEQGCDFESFCSSLNFDRFWGLTSGDSPFGPDAPNHDHTYENSSGHYMFFDLKSGPKFTDSIVSFNELFNLTNQNDQKCLKFYYTFKSDVPVNLTVRLVMGDLSELQQIWLLLNSQTHEAKNWTLAQVNLPSDAYSIQIFLDLSQAQNPTDILLTLDDVFITDECDGKITQESKVLYYCDFESNDCSFENTMRLEWKRTLAEESRDSLPKKDHTKNSSDGYFLSSSKLTELNGGFIERVVSPKIIIPDDGIPYCVSFYYYINTYMPRVYLFEIPLGQTEDVTYLPNNEIWNNYKQQKFNTWSWGVANLVPGKIKLAFLITNQQNFDINAAIDDIKVHSCYAVNNPKNSYDSWLSYYFESKCDFEENRCGFSETYDKIDGEYPSNWSRIEARNNFYPQLGPSVDHTIAEDTGHYLSVNFSLPLKSNFAAATQSELIFAHKETCLEFFYYTNTEIFTPTSKSTFGVTIGGCYGKTLFYINPFVNVSEPKWTRVLIQMDSFACREFLGFSFGGGDFFKMSIALDDFRVDRCDKINTSSLTTEFVTSEITTQPVTTTKTTTRTTSTTTYLTTVQTTKTLETTETTILTSTSGHDSTTTTTYKTTSYYNTASHLEFKLSLFIFIFLQFFF